MREPSGRHAAEGCGKEVEARVDCRLLASRQALEDPIAEEGSLFRKKNPHGNGFHAGSNKGKTPIQKRQTNRLNRSSLATCLRVKSYATEWISDDFQSSRWY
jgi:hypothetical protein